VSSAFRWDAETRALTLAKMAMPLDIHWSRDFTGMPTTVTISKDTAGRYFLSFLVEEAIGPLPLVTAMVGVDLGLKDVAVLSTARRLPIPAICTAVSVGWGTRSATSLANKKDPRIGRRRA
jgi:putative transposase